MTIPGATREQQLEHDLCDGAFNRDLPRVQAAIADGADLAAHGGRALHTAVCMNAPDVVRVLLEAGAPFESDRHPLHSATFYNRREIVTILLAASPTTGLGEGLRGAATQNHPECAALILEAGPTPGDIREALFWAVINDARETIRLLIDAGATPAAIADRAMAFGRDRFRSTAREIRSTLNWAEAYAGRTEEPADLALVG